MQASRLLLLSLFCSAGLLLRLAKAQLITQPPENAVTAQGTNATFTCRGNGKVIWEISGTQVVEESLVPTFAQEKIYVPLPTQSVSQLIVTATEMNNFTRTIQCLVDPGNVAEQLDESEIVRLLVYAEPHPPSDLYITVDGLNLVATWTEPFSLEGEEISYAISAVSNSGATVEEVTVDTPTYVFTGPTTGPRDCAEYTFSIFSNNNFSKSVTGLSGRKNIPTGNR